MRTYKAVLGYDGSGFAGWQVQKKGRTVQAAVERALWAVHGRKVRVTAASRTDSGVHAEGQVVHFRIDTRHTDRVLKRALNAHLPEAVVVRSVRMAPDDFHARYHARRKHYRYVIYNGPDRPLFDASYVTWIRPRLDVRAMRRAARCLIGRHDFTAFCSAQEDRVLRTQTLDFVRIKASRFYVIMDFIGSGFLRNMVRIMAGTLIEVGCGRRMPESVAAVLKSKDRRRAGVTAPSRGLKLMKVSYR